jgi:hypothetical protein
LGTDGTGWEIGGAAMSEWLSAVAALYGLAVPEREDPLEALADMLEQVTDIDAGLRRFQVLAYQRQDGCVLLEGTAPFEDTQAFIALYEGWPTTPPPDRCWVLIVRVSGGVLVASRARGFEMENGRLSFTRASFVHVRGLRDVEELVLSDKRHDEVELIDLPRLSTCSVVAADDVRVVRCESLRSLGVRAESTLEITDCSALAMLVIELEEGEAKVARCPSLRSLVVDPRGEGTSLRLEEIGVEELDLSDVTPRSLHVTRCPALYEVALEDDGDDSRLRDLVLDDCPNLHRVNWGECKPRELSLRNVALSRRTLRELPVRHLRQLDATRCHRLIDSHLERATELRELRVADVSGVVDLARIPVEKLEVLDISGCHGIRTLVPLRGASRLQELRAERLDQLRSLEGLEGCRNLDSLHLADCTGLENVDAVRGRTFDELDLSRCESLGHLESLPKAKWLYIDGLPCPKWVSLVDLEHTEVLDASNVPEANIGRLRGSKLVMLHLRSNRWLRDVRPLVGTPTLQLLATTGGARVVDDVSELRAGGVLVVGDATVDVPDVIRDWKLPSGLQPALHRLVDGWHDPHARVSRGLELVEALAAVHALARLTCHAPPADWRLHRKASFGTWSNCLREDPLGRTFNTLTQLRNAEKHNRVFRPETLAAALLALASGYESPISCDELTSVTCADRTCPLLLCSMDRKSGEFVFYDSVTDAGRVRLRTASGVGKSFGSTTDLLFLHRAAPDAFDNEEWSRIFKKLDRRRAARAPQ